MGRSEARERGIRMSRSSLFCFQCLLLAGIWAVSISAEDGADVSDLGNRVSGAQELLEVKPKIPNGPVVMQYKKLQAKKKMALEIAKQNKKLKPVFKRKKLKANAQKKNFKMMSDLEVKNIVMKKELKLKAAARDWKKELAKRKRRAKRYALHYGEKIDQSKERLKKIGATTKASFKLAQKTMRAMKTRKNVIDQAAEADAKRRDELRVGGLMHLKGHQLVIKELTDLNKLLAKAKKHPSLQNIRIVKVQYNHDAMWVAKENLKKEIVKRKFIARQKEKTRKKYRKEKHKKHALLAKQQAKNRKEAAQKKGAKEKLQKLILNSSEAGQKKLKKSREHALKKSAAAKAKEKGQKKRRNESKTKTAKEKGSKRPVEIYRKALTKMKERGKKAARAQGAYKKESGSVKNYQKAYNKASKKYSAQKRCWPKSHPNCIKAVKEAKTKLHYVSTHLKRHKNKKAHTVKNVKVAKIQRERSKKTAKERATKAHVKWGTRRRRINVKVHHSRSVSWSNAQIKATYGNLCVDAAQRNRSGGLVHMWPCNRRNWNQQWSYNSKTGLIKNVHGICLDASQRNTNGGKVHMWGCNANNYNQQWSWNKATGQIKNKHGLCLNTTNHKKVNMWRCYKKGPWQVSSRL